MGYKTEIKGRAPIGTTQTFVKNGKEYTGKVKINSFIDGGHGNVTEDAVIVLVEERDSLVIEHVIPVSAHIDLVHSKVVERKELPKEQKKRGRKPTPRPAPPPELPDEEEDDFEEIDELNEEEVVDD